MWQQSDNQALVKSELSALFPRLWRYSMALTGNRDSADDLAQAACLRAMEKADQFQAGTHFDRWLFRLTQRLWLNELRKQAVRKGGGLAPIEEVDLPDENLDPESNSLGREVLMGVMALPEAQRSVVLLAYVEGYRYREVAEILEVPIGTVMSRLSAARQKLTNKFGHESKVG